MKRLLYLSLLVTVASLSGCGASKEAGADRRSPPERANYSEETVNDTSPNHAWNAETDPRAAAFPSIEPPPIAVTPLEPIAAVPPVPVEVVPVGPMPTEPAPVEPTPVEPPQVGSPLITETAPQEPVLPLNPLRASASANGHPEPAPTFASSLIRPRASVAAPVEVETPFSQPAGVAATADGSDGVSIEQPNAAPQADRAVETNAAPTAAESRQTPRAIDVPVKATGADTTQHPGYKVVNVFYGTDRRAAPREGAAWTDHIQRCALPGLLLGVTIGLAVLSSRPSRQWLWAVTAVMFVAAGYLGYRAVTTTLTTIRRAEHDGPLYTSDLGKQLQVGTCEVTIPDAHKPGRLEQPSLLRLEVKEDVLRHVRLQRTRPLQSDEFYEQLQQRVALSPQQDLFIFIHGFNVTFEDAARRTAQMATDMDFHGAPVFFSWPAHDGFLATYLADEDHVATTTPHLKQFLLDVAARSGARSVHLMAHSMGNRALAAALKELELELKDQARLFDQVVFAAPDVFTEQFQDTLAPYLTRTANRFTLYASSHDWALKASKFIHRGPRAGDSGAQLLVLSKIDTIDVSSIDTSPFGHSYYGASDPILRDIKELFVCACAPSQRAWLGPANRDGLAYWEFQSSRNASADSKATSGLR